MSAPLSSLLFPSLLALSARASRGGRITGHGSGVRLGLPGRRGAGGGSGSLPPLRPAPAYFPSFLLAIAARRGPGEVRLSRGLGAQRRCGRPEGPFPRAEGSQLRRAQVVCSECSILRDTEIVYCWRSFLKI